MLGFLSHVPKDPFASWFFGTLGLLLGSLALVSILRLKVDSATSQLDAEMRARMDESQARHDAEVEFHAILQERERLAADLHDTLEQSLTGVALQLEASGRAPNPERAQHNLKLAEQMIARCREDVRRSVWNLRAQALEGQHLRAALRQIAESLLDATDVSIVVGGSGAEETLPDIIGGNLLMLAKEAVTNALKHGAPTRIDITVDYLPDSITVTLRDDGSGFIPGEVGGPQQGHFGLTGMKERAAKLGGRINIVSRPGLGTEISITTPSHLLGYDAEAATETFHSLPS